MQHNVDDRLGPPASLRLGIGPFEDPRAFLESGVATLRLAQTLVHLRPEHAIVDVGCGCGRVALALGDFFSEQGSYTGFDPDRACINWCDEHIAASDARFRFLHYDLLSDAYNPSGVIAPATFDFPMMQQYDVAILSSVITHLYPNETENYLRNLQNVLVPGGRALISALLMDEKGREAVSAGTTIFDFQYRVGTSCWTFDLKRPLDGIACDKDWLYGLLRTHGFEIESFREGNWRRIKSYEIEHDWIGVRKQA